MSQSGSNGRDSETLNGDAREALVAFAQRLVRIDEEIEGLKEDRKKLLKEIKGAGFAQKLFQEAVKHVREESIPLYKDSVAITELYMDALSSFATTPLGRAFAGADKRAAGAH